MMQCARQLTDPFDGFLLDKRYLIHDRDTKFTQAFNQFLRNEGVEPVVLPPQSPNLNARCERFIRSIKEEGEVGHSTGRVKRREHLGGLLSYYHREAA
jgi:hypothetical protein